MNENKLLNIDQKLYQRIIDNSYDSICVTDKDGRYIIANQATADCMQLSVDEILGKTPNELMEQNAYESSTIIEAIEKKEMVTKLVNVHGVNRLSTSTPLFDENGEIEYVVTNNRSDILIDEFSRQMAYEKERHEHFKKVANFLSNQQESDILFNSPKMALLLRNCKMIASTDSSVLITGESGVGKELVAKFIHKNSERKNQVFIAVNCSTIPPDLFESEFFGYQAGAFTGAKNKGKNGFLQIAHKGTLFLDELGELPLHMQTKLLRFVETGEFYPVGSTKLEKVDVRIVAATNQNLSKMVKDGSFRNDLFYRLNIFPIQIPPLRERPEDIQAIGNHFVERYNKKYKKDTHLSWQNLLLLMKYDWPGNVRELRNIIERAVLMAPYEKTELSLISLLYPENSEESLSSDTQAFNASVFELPDLNLPLSEALVKFEQEYIKAVLEYHNENVNKAAKSLGIHRTTLYRKLKNNPDE